MATSSSVAALTAHDAGGFSTALKGQDVKGVPVKITFTFEKLAGNTDGDYLQLARLHKSWCVVGIHLDNDSLSGMTDLNLGLVSDAAPGTAVDVDENVYADALDLNAGSSNLNTNYAFHTRDIAKMGQQVWQDAGAASMAAAAEFYRLAIHWATGGTATGTISGFVEVLVPGR